MKIGRIDITNFRGIKKLENYRPTQQNLLVGANNAGKTTILQALDFLLNPDRYWTDRSFSDLDFYGRNAAEGFAIEVWLTDLSDEDWSYDDWDLYREFMEPASGLLTDDSSQEAVLCLRMECREEPGGRVGWDFIYSKPEAERARITAEAKVRVGFRFIPGNREPLKELSFYQNSVLAKLVESPSLGEQVKDVIEALDAAGGILGSNARLTESLRQLRDRLADFGLLDQNEGELGLSVLSLSRRRLLQSFDLVLQQRGPSPKIPLAYHGLGIQNAALAFAILQHLEDQARENVILAYEEPEEHLEPALQRVLCRRLATTVPKQAQLFISTHSPEVARFFDATAISLVRWNGDEHRVIRLQGKAVLPRGEEKFFRRLESFWHESLLRCVFAQCVLIGEGGSEEGALPALFQELGRAEDLALLLGIEVVSPCTEGSPTGGIDQIPKFARFLRALEIPVIALIDAQTDDLGRLPAVAEAADWVIHWPKGEKLETSLLRSFPETAVLKAIAEWKAITSESGSSPTSLKDAKQFLDDKWKNQRSARQVVRLLCERARKANATIPSGPVASLLSTVAAIRRLTADAEGPAEILGPDGVSVLARRTAIDGRSTVYELLG